MSKVIRPTIRFGENQYKLIQAKLDELDVSFQRYAIELICRDLKVPVNEFDLIIDENQLSVDDIEALVKGQS